MIDVFRFFVISWNPDHLMLQAHATAVVGAWMVLRSTRSSAGWVWMAAAGVLLGMALIWSHFAGRMEAIQEVYRMRLSALQF